MASWFYIEADSYDTARDELGGSLEDARDSDIIAGFTIHDNIEEGE